MKVDTTKAKKDQIDLLANDETFLLFLSLVRRVFEVVANFCPFAM